MSLLLFLCYCDAGQENFKSAARVWSRDVKFFSRVENFKLMRCGWLRYSWSAKFRPQNHKSTREFPHHTMKFIFCSTQRQVWGLPGLSTLESQRGAMLKELNPRRRVYVEIFWQNTSWLLLITKKNKKKICYFSLFLSFLKCAKRLISWRRVTNRVYNNAQCYDVHVFSAYR
jgi:hypothetical protein